MAYTKLKGIKKMDELTQYTFIVENKNGDVYTYHEILNDDGDIEENILVDSNGHEVHDSELKDWAKRCTA